MDVSNQKWTAPKYRTVGFDSSVDESLFGQGSGRTELSVSRRKVTTGPLPSSAVVVSMDELNRIKNSAVIKTEAEMRADKERAMALREEKEKLSKQRKERMKDLEQRAVLLAKKSDIEISELAKHQMIREMAGKQIDDNKDAVKLLSSMAARATAFTVRDQQLEEKERLKKIEQDLERKSNIIIEIDRLKELQRREEEEKYKRTKRVEDRKVIIEQIATREKAKLLALEAREQENMSMRNLMKKYSEEDQKIAEKRREEIERSKAEVIRANEDAIRRKRELKEREKKEMEDILVYQALKDAELAKREEEEAAIERAKKERQIKLLDQQERAQNNAGKLDELRARRAAEDKERKTRQKEKEEARKRKAEMEELLASRAKQAADKKSREKVKDLAAQEEILQQLQYTKMMDEREERERRMKSEKTDLHKTQLQKQIEDRERAKKLGPKEDGPNIREELIKEEARLKVIRDRMVEDLIAQGVNPKYLSEMKNVDIAKIIKR